MIDARDGRGEAARLEAEAVSLASAGVDVIVTQGSVPTEAAKRATSRIPIVFGGAGDPVGRGLVSGLARPGGNVTGHVMDLAYGKAYEIMREIAPARRRAGLLFAQQGFSPAYREAFIAERRAAAEGVGFTLTPLSVNVPADIEPALEALAKAGGDVVLVPSAPLLFAERRSVFSLALRYRLASACGEMSSGEAGCLVTYSEDVNEGYRRAAGLVARILKGVKPADLPVEQSTMFKLIVNLKTATALGIAVPPSILARADEVIE